MIVVQFMMHKIFTNNIMENINNKYITKLNKIKNISKELDDINNYIKQNQLKYTHQLNECIRIFQLSNTYVNKIFQNKIQFTDSRVSFYNDICSIWMNRLIASVRS